MVSKKIIRSRRRTLSVEIGADGTVLVRAPFFLSQAQIDSFLKQKEKWILEKLQEVARKSPQRSITVAEREKLRSRAKELLPEKLALWSRKTDLSYSGVSITSAEKRFGSCNSKNHICLSLYLVLYPEPLVDYVMVHELCHTKEHNHSRAFYALVESILPDYREREQKLGENPLPRVEKT